jgi:hypothetical protein
MTCKLEYSCCFLVMETCSMRRGYFNGLVDTLVLSTKVLLLDRRVDQARRQLKFFRDLFYHQGAGAEASSDLSCRAAGYYSDRLMANPRRTQRHQQKTYSQMYSSNILTPYATDTDHHRQACFEPLRPVDVCRCHRIQPTAMSDM